VSRAGAVPVLRGLALAAGLLAVFGVLLASGDRVFADLLQRAVPDLGDLGPVPDKVLWFALAIAFAGGLAAAAGSGSRLAAPTPPGHHLGALESAIALIALDALFAAFVVVQATALFGHDEHVLRTAGLTYAEYARAGFGQLLVAAMLTLAVVAAAVRWTRVETGAERLASRGLLVLLCALTVVVLVSALHRLGLYQDAFGFSRLRLAADAFTLWVGAMIVLVVASLLVSHARWLPRACALVTGLAILTFALSDPDRRVAERNVDRFHATGQIDAAYLGHLSADAVPALVRLPAPLRDPLIAGHLARLRATDGWAGTNLARRRARAALH
jgi:hypothetical protein